MTWRIVVSQGPHFFVTSDNPGFYFEGPGLAKAESEFTLSLSSELALIGNWQGARAKTYASAGRVQGIVKEINRRVASGAERFVFYHRQREWIETIARRKKPYLSRINWTDDAAKLPGRSPTPEEFSSREDQSTA